jgi:hypothetical protein
MANSWRSPNALASRGGWTRWWSTPPVVTAAWTRARPCSPPTTSRCNTGSPTGRTVVERFVAERRPRLSADDREMVLGWREVVEGRFEVRRFEGDAVELHNLFDDVVTRLLQHGTRGVRRGAEADVRRRPDCAGPPGARRLAGQRALHREEFVQARGLGQPQRGHQTRTRHQIRIIEHRPDRVSGFHLRGVPCSSRKSWCGNSDSPAQQGHSRSTPRSRPHAHRWTSPRGLATGSKCKGNCDLPRVLLKIRFELGGEASDSSEHGGDHRHAGGYRRSHRGRDCRRHHELLGAQRRLDLAGSHLDPALPAPAAERGRDLRGRQCPA